MPVNRTRARQWEGKTENDSKHFPFSPQRKATVASGNQENVRIRNLIGQWVIRSAFQLKLGCKPTSPHKTELTKLGQIIFCVEKCNTMHARKTNQNHIYIVLCSVVALRFPERDLRVAAVSLLKSLALWKAAAQKVNKNLVLFGKVLRKREVALLHCLVKTLHIYQL